MCAASSPARPASSADDDDRPLARVRSYARRGSRLTAGQQSAWDNLRERWVLPESVAAGPLDSIAHFGRDAPLVVEIGSGNGESLAAMAAGRPGDNVLALEVWRPGVATALTHLERHGATHVRLLMADAETCLATLCGEGTIAELWTFFPDPWPKARHHKRRLVGPGFASTAASRLAIDGTWRLATDWADYADHIERVLGAEPLLAGGRVARWEERPVTKFERRGREAGRPATDFTYRRVRETDRR